MPRVLDGRLDIVFHHRGRGGTDDEMSVDKAGRRLTDPREAPLLTVDEWKQKSGWEQESGGWTHQVDGLRDRVSQAQLFLSAEYSREVLTSSSKLLGADWMLLASLDWLEDRAILSVGSFGANVRRNSDVRSQIGA